MKKMSFDQLLGLLNQLRKNEYFTISERIIEKGDIEDIDLDGFLILHNVIFEFNPSSSYGLSQD
ncbi:MAG: hypothetical protein AAGF85_17775 [Bacteroidota bacterium]